MIKKPKVYYKRLPLPKMGECYFRAKYVQKITVDDRLKGTKFAKDIIQHEYTHSVINKYILGIFLLMGVIIARITHKIFDKIDGIWSQVLLNKYEGVEKIIWQKNAEVKKKKK